MYKNADEETKINYLKQAEDLEEVQIGKEILKNQLIEKDGGLYYIVAPTEIINAKQLILNESQTKLVCEIYKAMKYKNYDNLDSEKIIDLYRLLINKMELYYPEYRKQLVKKFEDRYEQLKVISIEEKCNIIKQILATLHCNSSIGKIMYSDFKISTTIGRLNGRTISLDDISFIAESPTGMYSKKYKL